VVRSGESFYVFARLDPYEQGELAEKEAAHSVVSPSHKPGSPGLTRARRAPPP
jgi:hypothetical protein